MISNEYPLPTQQNHGATLKAEGFVTPLQDKKPQAARFLPTAVLPVIFLPGIMGSNLRMSDARQQQLHKGDNIAWRPDALGKTNAYGAANLSPSDRQLRLDPLQTTVDIYNPAGPPDVSGDGRHNNVSLSKNFGSPTMQSDPPGMTGGRTAEQKARSRGWGEVYFKSYGQLLQHLEYRLNNTFTDGTLRQEWLDVIGVDPSDWGAPPSPLQKPLTEEELREVAAGFWFPVYAFGYNWLESNSKSAKIIAQRINRLIHDFNKSGYQCKKVIVITHSMGGLVGRALLHPDYGDIADKVLGVVHGVMPAIGAPAAYKRMRAGFEDAGMLHGAEDSVGAKVAGNYGDEVAAVLANSPGGLQLLPSESYGNGWLRVKYAGSDLESWPKNGDPYAEIYKVRGKWYSLFRDSWINPSGIDEAHGGGSFKRTCDYLDKAQNFHRTISETFHPNSYAHYCADRARRSFAEVVWEIDKNCADPTGWQNWPILDDTKQGTLELVRWIPRAENKSLRPYIAGVPGPIHATILAPDAPGDQTVPVKSADYQIRSGMFKGVFRQVGYEHQGSFKDPRAVASTLYSVVRIAQEAKWER